MVVYWKIQIKLQSAKDQIDTMMQQMDHTWSIYNPPLNNNNL